VATSTLRELQELFWRSLTGEAQAALLRQIPGAGPLTAADRLEIYQRMYLSRLIDVLREDYPRVAEVLGAETFADLAQAYLAAHPSTDPSVRHVGGALADFLATEPVPGLPPSLADLARLEWARLEVFDAPDARPLAIADLAAMSAERMPTVRLALVPACVVVVTAWPVHEVWGEPAAAARFQPARTALRVWRQDFTVYHARVDAVEEAALTRLAAGGTFANVCELFAEASPEDAAREAGALLARWLEDGIRRLPPG
jgi:hypothetical protein